MCLFNGAVACPAALLPSPPLPSDVQRPTVCLPSSAQTSFALQNTEKNDVGLAAASPRGRLCACVPRLALLAALTWLGNAAPRSRASLEGASGLSLYVGEAQFGRLGKSFRASAVFGTVAVYLSARRRELPRLESAVEAARPRPRRVRIFSRGIFRLREERQMFSWVLHDEDKWQVGSVPSHATVRGSWA